MIERLGNGYIKSLKRTLEDFSPRRIKVPEQENPAYQAVVLKVGDRDFRKGLLGLSECSNFRVVEYDPDAEETENASMTKIDTEVVQLLERAKTRLCDLYLNEGDRNGEVTDWRYREIGRRILMLVDGTSTKQVDLSAIIKDLTGKKGEFVHLVYVVDDVSKVNGVDSLPYMSNVGNIQAREGLPNLVTVLVGEGDLYAHLKFDYPIKGNNDIVGNVLVAENDGLRSRGGREFQLLLTRPIVGELKEAIELERLGFVGQTRLDNSDAEIVAVDAEISGHASKIKDLKAKIEEASRIEGRQFKNERLEEFAKAIAGEERQPFFDPTCLHAFYVPLEKLTDYFDLMFRQGMKRQMVLKRVGIVRLIWEKFLEKEDQFELSMFLTRKQRRQKRSELVGEYLGDLIKGAKVREGTEREIFDYLKELLADLEEKDSKEENDVAYMHNVRASKIENKHKLKIAIKKLLEEQEIKELLINERNEDKEMVTGLWNNFVREDVEADDLQSVVVNFLRGDNQLALALKKIKEAYKGTELSEAIEAIACDFILKELLARLTNREPSEDVVASQRQFHQDGRMDAMLSLVFRKGKLLIAVSDWALGYDRDDGDSEDEWKLSGDEEVNRNWNRMSRAVA